MIFSIFPQDEEDDDEEEVFSFFTKASFLGGEKRELMDLDGPIVTLLLSSCFLFMFFKICYL